MCVLTGCKFSFGCFVIRTGTAATAVSTAWSKTVVRLDITLATLTQEIKSVVLVSRH